MGGCYNTKSLVAETEFLNMVLKMRMTGSGFAHIAQKIIEKSMQSSEKDMQFSLISKEKYLSVISSYYSKSSPDNELYDKLYNALYSFFPWT